MWFQMTPCHSSEEESEGDEGYDTQVVVLERREGAGPTKLPSRLLH